MANNTRGLERIRDDDLDDFDFSILESEPRLKWYLIDTERTCCKVWDFFITCLLIYQLIMVPYLLVFYNIYEPCLYTLADGSKTTTKPLDVHNAKCVLTFNRGLYTIELLIDIIYVLEIFANCLKRSRAQRDIKSIMANYFVTSFLWDVVGTFPELFMNEGSKFYWLKLFRCFIHRERILVPIKLAFGKIFTHLSKKKAYDLRQFAVLITSLCYICHVMGCAWLAIGKLEDCQTVDKAGNSVLKKDCNQSWVYKQKYEDLPDYTKYVFSFYFIFDVITTVGYGAYNGTTTYEYIFSIALEFMGLTFFAFLMGSINGILNTNDKFDDLIEGKI